MRAPLTACCCMGSRAFPLPRPLPPSAHARSFSSRVSTSVKRVWISASSSVLYSSSASISRSIIACAFATVASSGLSRGDVLGVEAESRITKSPSPSVCVSTAAVLPFSCTVALGTWALASRRRRISRSLSLAETATVLSVPSPFLESKGGTVSDDTFPSPSVTPFFTVVPTPDDGRSPPAVPLSVDAIVRNLESEREKREFRPSPSAATLPPLLSS
mmetsp:Transcript_7397/g.31376  ORF Transcript_7397/g.31376 Transcript_7397/m.31376 type:complete len:217 (-) Transcript_7397:20-670(-)